MKKRVFLLALLALLALLLSIGPAIALTGPPTQFPPVAVSSAGPEVFASDVVCYSIETSESMSYLLVLDRAQTTNDTYFGTMPTLAGLMSGAVIYSVNMRETGIAEDYDLSRSNIIPARLEVRRWV